MNKKPINFVKMSGAGNDFIVIDAVPGLNYVKLANKACNRTNGIGADGLLVLDKSDKSDYRMRIINADGSEAEMCGNGVRCMAAYIVANKNPAKKLFTVETIAGEILSEAKGEVAHVRLSNPKDYRTDVPLNVNGRQIHAHYIDTGVPHTIIFVDGLSTIDVAGIGKAIRYHEAFAPRGTNVDFVEQIKTDLVAVRTYERGVENETKACGTGSVAAAIVSYLKSNPGSATIKNGKMKVQTASGEILEVTFDKNNDEFFNVWLKGSAKFIAEGKYFL
jgi:diaminopimelate epimerase